MPSHPNRIVVPTVMIQAGTDFKFESDPYDVNLYGLLTPEQYTDTVNTINDKLRPARSGRFDGVLLATGPLLVPLAWWGVRHRSQAKRRKRLLKKAIGEFNQQNPTLYMRWNRRPQSQLTIERKVIPPGEQVPEPYQTSMVSVNPPSSQQQSIAESAPASSTMAPPQGAEAPDLLV